MFLALLGSNLVQRMVCRPEMIYPYKRGPFPPQFAALLGVELVRDMVCMYEQPTQQFHTVVALGSNVCGHRCATGSRPG